MMLVVLYALSVVSLFTGVNLLKSSPSVAAGAFVCFAVFVSAAVITQAVERISDREDKD